MYINYENAYEIYRSIDAFSEKEIDEWANEIIRYNNIGDITEDEKMTIDDALTEIYKSKDHEYDILFNKLVNSPFINTDVLCIMDVYNFEDKIISTQYKVCSVEDIINPDEISSIFMCFIDDNDVKSVGIHGDDYGIKLRAYTFKWLKPNKETHKFVKQYYDNYDKNIQEWIQKIDSDFIEKNTESMRNDLLKFVKG